MAAAAVAPARAAAFEVLLRQARARGPFDLTGDLGEGFAGLDARDRALAFELVTGTIKRRLTLDRVIAAFARSEARHTPVEVRESLRLAAFQLLFLERVPDHAVVSDAVQLVKGRGRRSAAFVNAVLRRIAEEGAAVYARLSEGSSAEALAARYSHPDWLAGLLVAEMGREAAEALMAADNQPAERCLRVNGLRATPAQARASLAADGVTTTGAPRGEDTPEALLFAGAPLHATAAFRDGLVTPQSRGSQLVGRVAAAGVRAGGRRTIADLCAAPGGKTAFLAALLPDWDITAVDDDAGRVAELRANLARLGVTRVQVVESEVEEFTGDGGPAAGYGLVLLDAPCSGLGTLASRADLRWRRKAGDVQRLAALQARLLAAAGRLVDRGGTLTYSVCTLSRAETIDVVEGFLSAPLAEPGGAPSSWELDDLGEGYPAYRHPGNGACLQTLPSRDGTTGFFIARFRRVG